MERMIMKKYFISLLYCLFFGQTIVAYDLSIINKTNQDTTFTIQLKTVAAPEKIVTEKATLKPFKSWDKKDNLNYLLNDITWTEFSRKKQKKITYNISNQQLFDIKWKKRASTLVTHSGILTILPEGWFEYRDPLFSSIYIKAKAKEI
jgi:hypothetical protein